MNKRGPETKLYAWNIQPVKEKMLPFDGNQHQFLQNRINRKDLSINLAIPLKPRVLCDQNS